MSSPVFDPSARSGASAVRGASAVKALRVNLISAVLVWATWLALSGRFAIHHLISDWKAALTMVFGSLVGGGTSVKNLSKPTKCLLSVG